MSRNVALGNLDNRFRVSGTSNTLTRNNANDNLDDGIEVENGATDNSLARNAASRNGSADNDGGFDLEDDNFLCDTNTWKNNTGISDPSQPCVQ